MDGDRESRVRSEERAEDVAERSRFAQRAGSPIGAIFGCDSMVEMQRILETRGILK